MSILILRFLHMLFMATWIGAVLFVSGDAKRTLNEPGTSLKMLGDRMNRANRIAAVSALATLATGVGLIALLGGMGSVPAGIHIGLVTSILMLLIGGGVIGRNARLIAAGAESGADRSTLVPHAKQMMIGIMIFHTLWVGTLALMVFRHQL